MPRIGDDAGQPQERKDEASKLERSKGVAIPALAAALLFARRNVGGRATTCKIGASVPSSRA